MLGFAKQPPARTTPAQRPQPVARPRQRQNPIAEVVGQLGAQPKLKLGAKDDPLEQEADRTAERVVNTPEPDSEQPHGVSSPFGHGVATVHRLHQSPSSDGHTEESGLHEHNNPEQEAGERELVPEAIHHRIERMQRQGRPLPQEVRAYMEPRFGQDFSRVRIHTDGEAAQLSEAIQARAFTLGEHIAFNRGAFEPHSQSGKKLIAHELTHVVQQGGASAESASKPTIRRGVLRDLGDGAKGVWNAGVDRVSGAYDKLTSAVGEVVDSAGDFIHSKGMDVVEHYSPALKAILDTGPVEWLQNKFSSVFDSLVSGVERLTPLDSVNDLSETFSEMLSKAGTILQALASGDCEPLFDAISQLKSFVTQVAGSAWDKLTDFLSPVGDFFSNLWNSTGAPAIEFLTEFGGNLWDNTKALLSRIWQSTEPLRENIGQAWSWVKGKLFGRESDNRGEREGGLINWLKDKAGEVWDGIKEKTRRFWQPIQEGVEHLRELVPPAFIKNLGEDMKELSESLGEAEQQLSGSGEEGPGAGLSENREALANALPSVKIVLSQVRGILVGAGDTLTATLGNLHTKVKGFFEGLGKLDLTRGLANSLSWIDDKIGDLHSWAEEKIEALFDRLVEGFDKLSPFVERALNIVQHVISVMADFAKLPPMVVSSAWKLIPECIRNPVQNFITNQILARIPVFGQLVAIPDIWEQAQATAMSILRKLFVNGDLRAAAWEFFEAVMNLIGLPPELVTSVLINAAGAIGDILSDPIGFLLNALKAAGQGFAQFVSNAGSHLMNGISGWLFGTLRKGGIEPPADFSLQSILGVVLQILDVTTDRVFERISERVGPSVTRRMRQMLDHATGAWSFLSTLVQEGPGALWQELQDQLSELGDQVLNSVVTWVSTTIVTQAGVRLAPLLAPTGVSNVVAAFMELYRMARAVVSQLEAVFGVLDRFLEGVGDIASGSLSQAADFLEQALSQTIPAALGLLANYAGLGNLSERIQEMVESIRGRVDEALDWLIERAIRLGQGFVDLARRGGRAVRRGARALVSWWQTEREFETDGGEQHSLYIDGEGEQQELIIESTPTPYAQFINALELPESASDTKDEALETERALEQHMEASRELETQLERSDIDEQEYQQRRDRLRQRLDATMGELVKLTKTLIGQAEASPNSQAAAQSPIYGSALPFGTSVYVPVLNEGHDPGEPAKDAPPNDNWDNSLHLRKENSRSYYVKGHLLNEKLGGPATWNNLVPLTQGANLLNSDSMYRRFEQHTQDAVHEKGLAINYIVTAHYEGGNDNSHLIADIDHSLSLTAEVDISDERRQELEKIRDIISAEKNVPDRLVCQSEILTENAEHDAFPLNEEISNEIEGSNIDDYKLTTTPRNVRDSFILNDTVANNTEEDAKVELQKFSALDKALAEKIVTNFPSGGYTRYSNLISDKILSEDQLKAIRSDDNLRLQLYTRGSTDNG